MPDTLQVPGQQPPRSSAASKPSSPSKHSTHPITRSKSPQSSRGRPRKLPPPPPPPTLREQIRLVRKHKYFVPALVLGLAILFGLVYSAIRISAVDPNSKPFTPPPPPAKKASSSPIPAQAKIVLDDKARQAALRKTWELEDARVKAASGGAGGDKKHDPNRWEELKEAMKDLHADDLTNMLHESYGRD